MREIVVVPAFVAVLTFSMALQPAAAESKHSRAVCSTIVQQNVAQCSAQVEVDDSGSTHGKTLPAVGNFGPVQFHTAYNLPCQVGATVPQSICATPASFGGQTIAIVDAFDDPTVESDLAVYDSQYGLPVCSRANGCLRVVNQRGGTNLPGSDGGWALEISMDVQISHAVCQTCKILLVEARSASFTDLTDAEDTAAALGATEISNSWGAMEPYVNTTTYDSSFNHPGVAVVAASGDFGATAQFPATSKYVLSAGGTSLFLNSNNTYNHETAWISSGSGCSSQEPANAWQRALANWNLVTCGSQRGSADVAADADPNTGAAVYDTTPYGGTTGGWYQVGGTSLASPLIASVIALAGGTASLSNAQALPYIKFNATNSHDVTTGSNGSCGAPVCAAGVGYDLPTGLGTPNGVAGF
jgi:subtilase family serine protease